MSQKLSNSQRNGGAFNQQYVSRSGSISSFDSFSSKQSNPNRPFSMIPRASSTNDLVSVDSKFIKASRSHKPSVTSTSVPSLSTRSNGLRMSQSQTNLSATRLSSIQSTSTKDMLLFNYKHNSFTPSARRQSLTSINQHSQGHFNYPQHHQQFNNSIPHHQHQTQRPSSNNHPKRRPNQRHSHDVPFTFPNGEIYIPRSKQRSSMTNIKSINSDHYQQHHPQNITQFDGYNPNHLHQTRFQSPLHTLAVPPTVNINRQNPSQPLHRYSGSTTSNSTSPSPSRNSRTESMNESTPSSSIDDLTSQLKENPNISFNETIEDIENNNLFNASVDTIPVSQSLDKIEESVTEQESPTIKNEEPPKSIIVEQKQKLEYLPIPSRNVKRPVVIPKSQVALSSTHTLKEASKPSKIASNSSTPVVTERKPSRLKKVFSSLFGRSKSEKRAKTAPSPVKKLPTSSIDPKLKISSVVVDKPKIEEPEIKNKVENFDDQASDQFSFLEGEEHINVQRNSSYFDSDEILQSMFAGLDSKPNTKIEINVGKQPEDQIKEEETDDREVVEPVNDNESETMTFDDMEMIEKIIQYGETSFPDLASPDLGEAQRKRMISKSIERKKSIRSISSARSKVSNNSTVNTSLDHKLENEDDLVIMDDRVLEVLVSEVKQPKADSKPSNSILKLVNDEGSQTKRVEFTNKIFINQTYSPVVYDRHSQPLTNLKINPQFIHQIRYELNEFKRSMEVHEASKANTHFFQ